MKLTKSELIIAKSKTRRKNSVARKDCARKFRFTGNIAHIESYVRGNMRGADCMVEIYVRPLTQVEKEIYGGTSNRNTNDNNRVAVSGDMVTPQTHNVFSKSIGKAC